MRPPKRLSANEQIAQLQDELLHRLLQFDAVKKEQDQLLLRQKVLAHFCDTLALLRQQRGDASLVQQQEEWASDAEAALLLQQQCRTSIVSSSYWAGCETEARVGFAFVRHVTTQPLLPGAATMTLAELVASYSATVRELSLLLHVIEAGGAPPAGCSSGSGGCDAPAPAPLQRLQELLLQYFHRLLSLEQCGRQQVIVQFNLTDCETGGQRLVMDYDRHRWVAERLQLSQLQRREIGESVRIVQQLLAPVRQEAGELRTLLAGVGDSTHGGGGGGGPSVEERQQWALRLSMLVRKERWMQGVHIGLIISCLTWVQWARVSVLMYPYHPAYLLLATGIASLPEGVDC